MGLSIHASCDELARRFKEGIRPLKAACVCMVRHQVCAVPPMQQIPRGFHAEHRWSIWRNVKLYRVGCAVRSHDCPSSYLASNVAV